MWTIWLGQRVQFLFGKLQIERRDGIFQVLHLAGADDRRGDARLLKQPRKRDLRVGDAAPASDLARRDRRRQSLIPRNTFGGQIHRSLPAMFRRSPARGSYDCPLEIPAPAGSRGSDRCLDPGTAESSRALLRDTRGCSDSASRRIGSGRVHRMCLASWQIARRTWMTRRCKAPCLISPHHPSASSVSSIGVCGSNR